MADRSRKMDREDMPNKRNKRDDERISEREEELRREEENWEEENWEEED